MVDEYERCPWCEGAAVPADLAPRVESNPHDDSDPTEYVSCDYCGAHFPIEADDD